MILLCTQRYVPGYIQAAAATDEQEEEKEKEEGASRYLLTPALSPKDTVRIWADAIQAGTSEASWQQIHKSTSTLDRTGIAILSISTSSTCQICCPLPSTTLSNHMPGTARTTRARLRPHSFSLHHPPVLDGSTQNTRQHRRCQEPRTIQPEPAAMPMRGCLCTGCAAP